MATEAGIGGSNAVFVGIETVYGTYEDPATSTGGLWVPILEESLVYTESKYYSEQIREEVVDSEVSPSYYHVEGDITMEVDCKFLPLFLYASRHTVTKAAGPPIIYTAVPNKTGSAYPGGTQKGLSITVVRNGEGFGYGGCVVGGWSFNIDNGILRVTMNMMGLSETLPTSLDTTAWVAASLLGADAHSVFVDASGVAPAFGAGADRNFNGFTIAVNHNAEAQNRIVPERSATFVKYGKSELSYDTELDFLTRTEYDNFKNSTTRAIQLQSIKPGGVAGTWGAATEGVRITFYRSNYDTYTVNTPGIGDIQMAQVVGHGLVQAGGTPYKIECISTTDIA